MIKKVQFTLSLTSQEINKLNAYKPWSGKHWTEPTDEIVLIKSVIKTQLHASQITCAYCGLKFKGPYDAQIEHIAPKASYRNPQFTFTLKNLVLGCGYCNQLTVKGTKPTIDDLRDDYEKCTFLLVHPYLDNPDDHYEWADKDTEILIQVKNNSSKGAFSIKMFTLDSVPMSELRASQVRMDELKVKKALSKSDEILVQNSVVIQDK